MVSKHLLPFITTSLNLAVNTPGDLSSELPSQQLSNMYHNLITALNFINNSPSGTVLPCRCEMTYTAVQKLGGRIHNLEI